MTPFTYRVVNFLKRAESEDYFDREHRLHAVLAGDLMSPEHVRTSRRARGPQSGLGSSASWGVAAVFVVQQDGDLPAETARLRAASFEPGDLRPPRPPGLRVRPSVTLIEIRRPRRVGEVGPGQLDLAGGRAVEVELGEGGAGEEADRVDLVARDRASPPSSRQPISTLYV